MEHAMTRPVRTIRAITADDLPDFIRDLRFIAHRLLDNEGNAQSVQTTALVDSALVRMIPAGQTFDDVSWNSRGEFFGLAKKAMRHALIDHARRRKSLRRRAELRDVTFTDTTLVKQAEQKARAVDAVQTKDIQAALQEISEQHSELRDVIFYCYWLDMPIRDACKLMGRSKATVRRARTRVREHLLLALGILDEEHIRQINQD
jgi:RNA polymerase sigma factor (sigma-70 family)